MQFRSTPLTCFLALQLAACTAELVAVPLADGAANPRRAERDGPKSSSAAGRRAPRTQTSSVSSGAAAEGGGEADADFAEDDAGESIADLDASIPDRPDATQLPAPSADDLPPMATTEPPSAPRPFEPPIADDCITDPKPGDHTFRCGGLTFLMMVDAACTRSACGLIVDVHGGGMTAAQMRATTALHELAPRRGYLVIHPNAAADGSGGTWTEDTYPSVADFVQRAVRAFHVDPDRIHVTGFSQGADMTFWFLCNHPNLIASAAAASRLLPGAGCIGGRWRPRVPILYMHGSDDLLTILGGRAMIEDIVARLSLGAATEIEAAAGYTHQRWTEREMTLDYIEHDYRRLIAGGHCVPGGTDSLADATMSPASCTLGDIQLDWGALALQWFIDHPRTPRADTGP